MPQSSCDKFRSHIPQRKRPRKLWRLVAELFFIHFQSHSIKSNWRLIEGGQKMQIYLKLRITIFKAIMLLNFRVTSYVLLGTCGVRESSCRSWCTKEKWRSGSKRRNMRKEGGQKNFNRYEYDIYYFSARHWQSNAKCYIHQSCSNTKG